MKKPFFIICLLLLSAFQVKSQTLSELMQKATEKEAEGEYLEAALLYSQISDMGNDIGALKFGEMISNRGVRVESYDNIFVMMTILSEKYAAAQYFLGYMYENGLGTEANPNAAAVAYMMASDNGIAAAQYRLGVLCENGSGIPKDTEMARQWYTMAAENGFPEALDALRRISPGGGIREIDMVSLKGGTFMMGSDSISSESGPRHSAEVSPFYISRTEITNNQYCKFLNGSLNEKEDVIKSWIQIGGSFGIEKCRIVKTGNNKYEVIKGFENFPVVFITWEGASAFCKWLSKETGSNYRLPTEMEWEYAASGGNGTGYIDDYSGGTQIDSLGWYVMNSGGGAMPVGLKKPNAFGLYDMSGNVWEWCSDFYRQNVYRSGNRKDSKGPITGVFRVIRGGAWNTPSSKCIITVREQASSPRYDTMGFRIVSESL